MSKLIVFEGIDGAGKTTVSRKIVEILSSKGFKTFYTREPSDSPFAQLLNDLKTKIDTGPIIDALAMSLDRAFHMMNEVEPRLAEGYVVVMDRYYHSTIAYQGAMGADIKWIRDINRVFRRPDIAFYLDVSVETAMRRIRDKKSRWPFYEFKDFLSKVRDIYLKLVKENELIYVDAERDLNDVINQVIKILREKTSLNI
ncbi:MAG: dTMP kinase [Desulfurococcales archaeon]|jgi:dTMP kinase|nr:dTMP kinase [Desulfurococcales archaeon]